MYHTQEKRGTHSKMETAWQHRVVFVLISFFKKLVAKMCR